MKRLVWLILLIALFFTIILLAGCGGGGGGSGFLFLPASHPGYSRFAYVININDHNVSTYVVDAETSGTSHSDMESISPIAGEAF